MQPKHPLGETMILQARHASLMSRFPLLIALVVVPILVAGAAQGATLTVCAAGCDFTDIQSAIDAAAPGDIIDIGEGLYSENLRIDKDVTLRGERPASTVISARFDRTVDIWNSVLTLSNLTIREGFVVDEG